MIIFKEIEVIVEVNTLKKIMPFTVWYFAINSSSFKSLIYRDFFFIFALFKLPFFHAFNCNCHATNINFIVYAKLELIFYFILFSIFVERLMH